MTIKQKILATIILTLLISVTVITGLASNISSSAIKQRLEQVELPAVLNSVSSEINHSLSVPITVSHDIAINPANIQFITDGEQPTALPHLIRYLNAVKTEHKAIATFFVSAKTGRYYTDEGLFKTVTVDNPRDAWFYNFSNSGKRYELALDVHEVSGKSTLFINYAIKDQGEFLGVTGIGLSLDSEVKKIREQKIGATGQVFLVDGKGKIKLHQRQDLIGKALQSQANDDVSKLLQRTGTPQLQTTNERGDVILATKYLPELDWYVIAEIPTDEVYGDVTRSIMMLVIAGAVIAVCSIGFCSYLINSLVNPLSEVASMLEDISSGEGDLTKRLDASRQDEIGRLGRGYNKFVDSQEQLLRQIREASLSMYQLIESVEEQINAIDRDVSTQQAQTEQVATAIHEMGHTVQEIARSAANAADNAKQANDDVTLGNQAVHHTISQVNAMGGQIQQTSSVIQQLATNAASIDTVLEVIRAVSEQTNLLALNAAIEAARAGEQGRGFAVVADEVRTLAQRSHTSTEEIRTIIEKLQQSSSEAVAAMNQGVELTSDSQSSASESGDKLALIANAIATMNDMNTQIAAATEEQSTVVNEVSSFITGIADIAQANAHHSSQASGDCDRLRTEANTLKELVAVFKLSS